MNTLCDHPNVHSTCLELLRRHGYAPRAEIDARGDAEWIAELGAHRFVAADPLKLLGLCALHRELAPPTPTPYWWSLGEADRRAELLEAARLRAAPMLALARAVEGPRRVAAALQSAEGDRRRASEALGLDVVQLTALAALPAFAFLDDEPHDQVVPAPIDSLHDATLLEVRADVPAATVRLIFRTATGTRVLSGSGLLLLALPHEHPWGPSSSVLRLEGPAPVGEDRLRASIEMQSGDVLVVEARILEFEPGGDGDSR